MPKVSVIIPCNNEQSTIRLLLNALYEQTFPRAEMEVILADGMSTDGTRDVIAAFQKDFPDLEVRVVDNTLRNIPSGVGSHRKDLKLGPKELAKVFTKGVKWAIEEGYGSLEDFDHVEARGGAVKSPLASVEMLVNAQETQRQR